MLRAERPAAEDILKYVGRCRLSSVELMGDPAEQFAGAPTGGGRGRRRGRELTDEQKKAQQQKQEQLLDWRLSVSMDKYRNLHIKDRKVNGSPNMPFGLGDTPVALILQLIKRERWTFPADIELEYKVPEGSDAVAEVARCVQICSESLA